MTDFDRQILLEHVERPRPVTAEYVAAMITHPQPPGVDVVTWVTGSSVIRWQTRSTSHVKRGRQGLVSLVAYHRPSRRAWWVTPYASGPGLGEPWARATLRDDAKAVRLWVEDPQGRRGAEIEFPLPRFGPPGFVVVESESGAAVLP